jgi:basic membrane protein A
VTLAAVLTSIVALSGCGAGTTSDEKRSESSRAGSGAPETGRKIAALFPGLIDDHSWNQAGYDGLMRARKEGATIAYTERVTQDQQVEVFRNYARQGYRVIIGLGGEFMDAAMQVATEFPHVSFVVCNGTKAGGNVTTLALSYGDMGYLAGALAGQMTKSKQVAMVSGQAIPIARDAERGFRAGVARVAPDVTVKVTFTGSFDDLDKNREAALALIDSGADVVWQVLDSADAGVLSAAEDKGVMAIGLYADQQRLAPTAHIGAALADPATIVYRAATDALDGRLHHEGVADGIVSIGAYSSRVPPEVRERVRTAREDLASGRVSY